MGEEAVRLTARQFQAAGGVGDWRVLAWGAAGAWFGAPSLSVGAGLVRRIAELVGGGAGGVGRLPDVDVRADGVRVRIVPGPAGLTGVEVGVARAVSAAAADLGLVGDPSGLQAVQLAVDAVDRPAVLAFWRAVLGYERSGDDVLVDGLRRDPSVWFQQQDEPRPLRNRIHVDVARPQPQSLTAVAATKAVGGREAYVGGHVTLADTEGNEADLFPLEPGDELGDVPATADWWAALSAMTYYPTTSPLRAADLAVAVASHADNAGLPLGVDLRPDGVTIDSGKDQWYDEQFGELARRVQEAARGMGLTADPTRLRFVQIGIDAVDIPAVREFWRAVLGYESHSDHDIYDPRQLNLPIFFQQMPAAEEARRKQRNRIHVDVFVPHDQAQARIERAIAAGGRIAYDDEAPEWWTLADPEGNEVDIAVSVGREEHWQAAKAQAN